MLSSALRRSWCVAIILGSAPTFVYSQQSVSPWDAPHFSMPARDLYRAISLVPVTENANVLLFDDDEQFTFDDAGRLTHVGHYIYKVLNSKGAEGWHSLSVGWDPWHETRPIVLARVIE